MRRLLLILAVTAVGLGMLVPAALADDKSIYAAYVSRDSDFVRLNKRLSKDIDAWIDAGRKKPGRALKTIRKLRGACSYLIAAMKREASSSDNGRKAKKWAITSVRPIDGSLRLLGRTLKVRSAGHVNRAERLAYRSDALALRSERDNKRARKFFKAAGVELKPH